VPDSNPDLIFLSERLVPNVTNNNSIIPLRGTILVLRGTSKGDDRGTHPYSEMLAKWGGLLAAQPVLDYQSERGGPLGSRISGAGHFYTSMS
jgi:hypothetical protein